MTIFDIFNIFGFDLNGYSMLGAVMVILGISILLELGIGFDVFSSYGGRFHKIINIISVFLVIFGFVLLFASFLGN